RIKRKNHPIISRILAHDQMNISGSERVTPRYSPFKLVKEILFIRSGKDHLFPCMHPLDSSLSRTKTDNMLAGVMVIR
ncbi:MAG: hypothetical protein IKD68_06470, partial [Solobacterium sp.]|nr:hypothetical protein [Solobacterium sp.]